MRAIQFLAFVVLCASGLYGQAEWPKPNWEKLEQVGCRRAHKVVSSAVGAFQVRLVPVPLPERSDFQCRAYLVDRAGKQTLLLEDWEVSIHQGTGDDVFGDGSPSLILEGYSGGAHCCYTYKIARLGGKPEMLASIENETPFFFFKDPASGRFRIMASDGAFDYFDGLCHACTPFPRVVLQVEAGGLRDVSSQFVDQYDSQIALARAKIAEGNIGKFLAADFEDARKVVLEIVLAYLYSGREEQAWQTLDEMWPAADRERVQRLILKTRAEGILSKLKKSKTAAPSYTH
jgi:hypothetical protein